MPNPEDLTSDEAIEYLRRALSKTRSRLVVEIDLDPIPGWGHTAEDHRALVQRQLDEAVPHYNPTVTVTA
jgi:hypothetical protein